MEKNTLSRETISLFYTSGLFVERRKLESKINLFYLLWHKRETIGYCKFNDLLLICYSYLPFISMSIYKDKLYFQILLYMHYMTLKKIFPSLNYLSAKCQRFKHINWTRLSWQPDKTELLYFILYLAVSQVWFILLYAVPSYALKSMTFLEAKYNQCYSER